MKEESEKVGLKLNIQKTKGAKWKTVTDFLFLGYKIYVPKRIYVCISGGGHGNSLHYSRLENLIDRGSSQATVHGVSKSQT